MKKIIIYLINNGYRDKIILNNICYIIIKYLSLHKNDIDEYNFIFGKGIGFNSKEINNDIDELIAKKIIEYDEEIGYFVNQCLTINNFKNKILIDKVLLSLEGYSIQPIIDFARQIR